MTPDALERERPYLMGIAYRLLGSTADAEDIVQEALVRGGAIDDARTPRALLTTIVTRLCLDELRSARRRREAYVGPWLPEPVATGSPAGADAADPSDRIGTAESVSIAFLLLLESLSPHQRAVFVLREVFDLEFAEIAAAVGKSEAACRQLLHRAREAIAAGRRRVPPRPAQEALAHRFLAALASADLPALLDLLVADATSIADHGGKAQAAMRPILGAERVARLVVGLLGKSRRFDARHEPTWLNGNPAVLTWVDGALYSALILDTVEQGGAPRLAGLHIVRNPDKLAAIRTLDLTPTPRPPAAAA